MLRYLLDTNIVINVLKQRPVEVLSSFNAKAAQHYGAMRAALENSASPSVLMPCTLQVTHAAKAWCW
jgi:predicted nucleic acid-binding protein